MSLNITNSELKFIKKQLPDLRKVLEPNDSFLESGVYKKIFISIFDHWLTAEEANKEIDVDNDKSLLESRRTKFKTFIDKLSASSELYTWRYKRHNRLHIQKPRDSYEILKKCDLNNLTSLDGKRYGFIIPEFSAIYEEEWDWTNILWYTKDNQIKPIVDIANSCGLHILK